MDNRNELIVNNLGLARKVAHTYAKRSGLDFSDLQGEAFVGLVKAADKFDPSKGTFSSFAYTWIRASVAAFLLDNARTVKLSGTRTGRKLFHGLARVRARLEAQELPVNVETIAAELKADADEVAELLPLVDQAEARLDATVPVGDEGAEENIGSHLASDEPAADARIEADEFHNLAVACAEAFEPELRSARERAIWIEHLMAETPVTLADLGRRFGVTRARMHQEANALRKRYADHVRSFA